MYWGKFFDLNLLPLRFYDFWSLIIDLSHFFLFLVLIFLHLRGFDLKIAEIPNQIAEATKEKWLSFYNRIGNSTPVLDRVCTCTYLLISGAMCIRGGNQWFRGLESTFFIDLQLGKSMSNTIYLRISCTFLKLNV